MGEVDQLQDPVDERVAERDDGEDAPGRDADQRDVDELLRIVDEVAEEDEGEEADEDEPDDREGARAVAPTD